MILDAISSLELKALTIIHEEEKRINSLLKIRQHLSQIDFEMEVVPLIDEPRLKNLLEFLKGEQLDDGEMEVISQLTQHMSMNQ